MKPQRVVRLGVNGLNQVAVNAAKAVLDSGRVTQGRLVQEFEAAVLRLAGAGARKHAAMVNSGSSALLLAASLLRQRVGPDFAQRNEVIFPAVAWATTVAPFIQAGFRPVFVDVGPDYCIDPKLLEDAITERTCAIVPVHLLGNVCDMERVQKIGNRYQRLTVIEDCCEALGASFDHDPVGGLGDAAAFSFYYSHHLQTIEGGAIVYRKEYSDVKAWREHGWIREYPEIIRGRVSKENPDLDPRWIFDKLGWNLRSTDLNAAIGLAQLPMLDEWKRHRQRTAADLDTRFQRFAVFRPNVHYSYSDPNPFSYPVMIRPDAGFTRADLARHLEACGIETRPVMSGNMTRHPWYRRHKDAYTVAASGLAQADLVHEQAFLLPCHPEVGKEDVEHMVASIEMFLAETSKPGA